MCIVDLAKAFDSALNSFKSGDQQEEDARYLG